MCFTVFLFFSIEANEEQQSKESPKGYKVHPIICQQRKSNMFFSCTNVHLFSVHILILSFHIRILFHAPCAFHMLVICWSWSRTWSATKVLAMRRPSLIQHHGSAGGRAQGSWRRTSFCDVTGHGRSILTNQYLVWQTLIYDDLCTKSMMIIDLWH